jgi:hypothetical protein
VADHVVQGREVDREPGPAGGDREGDGQVRLACSGRTQQGGVGLGGDERQGRQVLDLAGVELGLEGEVELVQLSDSVGEVVIKLRRAGL